MSVFCLVGASGVGKSTILEFLNRRNVLNIREVSARPYLPNSTDYVNGLTEQAQVLITQHRFVDILNGLQESRPTIFSRSPIDSLAYEYVLNKAPFLQELLERQVESSKIYINYIYIPVEFEMSEGNDIVRGTNREIQLDTDSAILNILIKYNINYLLLSGNQKERELKLIEYMKGFSIYL